MPATRPLRGTEETRSYYDYEGWRPSEKGTPRDVLLWRGGDGPIRREGNVFRRRRVREALTRAGAPLELLECGCGGNPATDLLAICHRYTGLDFSTQGLAEARARLRGPGVPIRLVEGDMCALPFPDASFDAVYSSNALYHIEDAAAQATALREIARVTRPGGVVVLIVANPRPLLFPIRMARRLVADAPVLGSMADRVRSGRPIPYNPRPVGWMRRQLEPFGRVHVSGYTLPSVWFNKRVSEHRGSGRAAWQTIAWLEREHPELVSRLGCYVWITLERAAA